MFRLSTALVSADISSCARLNNLIYDCIFPRLSLTSCTHERVRGCMISRPWHWKRVNYWIQATHALKFHKNITSKIVRFNYCFFNYCDYRSTNNTTTRSAKSNSNGSPNVKNKYWKIHDCFFFPSLANRGSYDNKHVNWAKQFPNFLFATLILFT